MLNTVSESFPIRTVAEVTGVNAVTLRAWERRYGLVNPSRTPKGHRIYTQHDIRLIQQILERLSQGMSISQITHEILDKTTDDKDQTTDPWGVYKQRMIGAIINFDEHRLDAIYNDAMSLYSVDIVTMRLFIPLLDELGTRWEKQTGNIAEEHFFSVYLRNKLGARFHHQNLNNTGPRLVVACLPGEQHEFGILLFAFMAQSKGYQIIMLGTNLPVTELNHVANRTNCKGIVLAGSAAFGCEVLFETIKSLTELVSIPVFVGGDVTQQGFDEITRANALSLGRDLAASLHIITNRINQLPENRL